MFCQRCGKRNEFEAESCAFCGAPLFSLKSEPTDVSLEAQAVLGIDDHFMDKLLEVERVALRSSKETTILIQAVDYVERNLMVNRAGLNVLVEMLCEKGLLDESRFRERWRERTLSKLTALDLKECFTDAKAAILSSFGGVNRRRFDGLVLKAEDHLFAYNHVAALALLEEALQSDPQNGPLLAFLGESGLKVGDYDGARAHLTKAVALKRKGDEALLPYAHLMILDGALKEAEEALMRAVKKEDFSAMVWTLLSLVKGLRGEWKKCSGYAERALELEQAPAALYLHAHALLRLKKTADAEKQLDLFLSDYPESAEGLHQRFLLLLARGWWRRAAELIAGLKRIAPDEDYAGLVNRFRAASPEKRKTMCIEPLDSGKVLGLMDEVAEEADIYLG